MEKTRTATIVKYVLALAVAVSVLLTARLFAQAASTAGEGGTVEVNTTDVNVRVSADAGSQKVGQVTTGEKFTVLGSTTGADGKLWYNISGTIGGQETTGYIRSDFVNVIDAGNGGGASEGGDADAPETSEEPEASEPSGEDVTSSISNTSYAATALQPESDPPVIPEGFTEIKLKVAGADDVRGWSNGKFTIFYGSDQAYTGWFLYENETYRYVRYTDFLLNMGTGSDEGKSKGGNGLNIFLLVLCIILAAACVVMGIKLFGNRDDDYDDDDDDDEEDDGDFRPAKRGGDRPQRESARPVRPGQGGAAAGSRPVSARSAEGGARPQRPAGDRPVRQGRPAEGGARPQRPAGDRPVRQGRAPEGSARTVAAPTRRSGGAQQVRQSRPADDFDDED
jgi:uncharacterized protein YgiM (DUF1202 family)